MEKTIGIIGLGRCGMPAVERFLEMGYQVYGHARRAEVITALERKGGIHTASPEEMARKVKTIIVMVLNDDQVFDVVIGSKGILQSAGHGHLVICMSTINRSNLQTIDSSCRKKSVDFVDCPFTGGPARVSNGTLTLITAAKPEVIEKVRPYLEVIGKVTNVGDLPGFGQAVKHCNQLMVCAIHAATMEVITLAEKTGVDPKQVCQVVGSGIGGSNYFELLSKAILDDGNSPGGMGQLWKDINLVINTSREKNLPLLIANATAHYFDMAVSQGLANEDSARIMQVMRRMVES
ncbi:3-hydroxyisobutyrate dehydrogenase [Desulfosarcina widdelii]|uniref:3-hydroxyisobutyrate dehydrogenase n=1 Tax=Desulfosarcina widdelii TaxID=947919 RepID=A0A5K7YTK1_9BACT|nr:NAD(P)-dependent oxidoreductase [Desulfosarcina widdelii]BBO73162.1 3-hydroxyisobutyrate dehydrogenase [Desulfosarcina widdelii]